MGTSTLSITGLVVAGVAFVVLYVILSVTLWVSLIVAAGILAVTVLITGGTAARESKRAHRGHQTTG